jgi:radical SAM protein with 4Fe4S-binding SPASM domain
MHSKLELMRNAANPGQIIPIEQLRRKRRTAAPASYSEPTWDMLAADNREGKAALDRLTHHELSGPADACKHAAPAVACDDDSYDIPHDRALPLMHELSHRRVDGAHLWIGVQEGIAIVLDDEEHALFLALKAGESPDALVTRLCAETPQRTRAEQWQPVAALVGRLAGAGFLRGIQGYTDVRPVRPDYFARFHLTQRCNLSCIHCYADSSPYVDGSDELSPARWMKIIDDFADCGGGRVLFTGGEALAYKGAIDLMRHAKKRGLEVQLFSNGVLVKRHIRELAECVDEVQISIDGPDSHTNDPIRGHGSFESAVEAVDLLIEAGIRVRVGMVVMERNWDSMKNGFVGFARRWQGKPVTFRLGYGLTHHGRGEDLTDGLTVYDTRATVDQLMAQVEGPRGPRIARRAKGCGYAEQLVIAPDGNVHPCHLLDGALTHVDSMPMPEILKLLKGTAYEYDVDHNVGCGTCDIRNLCGGTCRVQNGKSTGNRRVTTCTAPEKLDKLRNLVKTFAP